MKTAVRMVGTLIGVVAILVFVFQTRSTGDTGVVVPIPRTNVEALAGEFTAPVLHHKDTRQAIGEASPAPAPTPLLTSYNEMKSARPFVFHARQHPELGGHYYAAKVVDYCAGVHMSGLLQQGAGNTSRDDTLQTQQTRDQALRQLQQRCADFSTAELDEQGALGTLRQSGSRDPLWAVSKAYSNSSGNSLVSNTERRSAIEAAIRTRDPLLIGDLGIRLVLHQDESGQPFVYFNGDRLSHRDPAAHAAFYLVPCALGLRCDRGDPELLSQCASGGTCHEDRYARARAELTENDPSVYEAAISLAQRIADAVRSGDTAAFLPSSAPR